MRWFRRRSIAFPVFDLPDGFKFPVGGIPGATEGDQHPVTLHDWRMVIDRRRPVHMSVEDICKLILAPDKDLTQVQNMKLVEEPPC